MTSLIDAEHLTMNFIGESYELGDEPYGTVCLKDNDLYLSKGGDSWVLLTSNSYITDYTEPEIKYLKPELSICECCGAPLRGNKCEYCGSTYIWK